MSEVQWIKFYVNILTNPKIKRIRRMPGGDTIALIWAYLLAQAGDSNKDGAIYFTDEIPYSADEFAVQYDFELDTTRLAVKTFEKFGMIGVFDGIIYIKNWEKYQSIDGLDKIRKQNSERQRIFKEKKKLQLSNVTDNVTTNAEVTHGNATDIELELDLDIDIKEIGKKQSRFTPPTTEEVKQYCLERANNVDSERFIDFYTSKGWMIGKNKMKDWKAGVRNWEKKDKETATNKPKTNNKFKNFKEREYDFDELEKKLQNKQNGGN